MLLACLTTEADDDESESDGNADEHDLDNEGGDLGTEECDKLDEQMWGSDDEEPVKVRAKSSFLGRLFLVDLMKWVSNVRPSVCTTVRPQKVSSISMKFGM